MNAGQAPNAYAHPIVFHVRAVVLVEGVSDQRALEALAERRGRRLGTEGVAVEPIGGSKNIGNFLARFGPEGSNVRLAGLCDLAEEGDFRRGLERAGLGANLDRAQMERLGFFVCEADLEDELIRSLGHASVERIVASRGELIRAHGPAAVEEILAANGDLGPFRTFQKQPEWRARSVHEQLRRFIGTHSGRKATYAALLVRALDLDRVPRPLDGVLAHV
jgi:hypothetical protein